MAYDYSKLSLRIVEKFGTQEAFADAMELSEETISKKINNKTRWTDRQISKAVELLEIESTEIPEYFFKQKVQII